MFTQDVNKGHRHIVGLRTCVLITAQLVWTVVIREARYHENDDNTQLYLFSVFLNVLRNSGRLSFGLNRVISYSL